LPAGVPFEPPPPPLLLLPPHAGSKNIVARAKAKTVYPRFFRRRAGRRTIPAKGNATADSQNVDRAKAVGAVVVIVSVVVAPPLVGVTGLVEKLVALHCGAGVPVPVTAQVRLTDELYPLSELKVTVDIPELPAFRAAGVVAEIVNAACVYLATKASVTPPP
jgi:hypothetical protein